MSGLNLKSLRVQLLLTATLGQQSIGGTDLTPCTLDSVVLDLLLLFVKHLLLHQKLLLQVLDVLFLLRILRLVLLGVSHHAKLGVEVLHALGVTEVSWGLR